MNADQSKRSRLQFPLWVLLFVLPTIVALISGYFLLLDQMEKEIVARQLIAKEKTELRQHEQRSLALLQEMGQLSEEDWQKLTSAKAVWRRLVDLRLHSPTRSIGPYQEVPEIRLFSLRASDEQVVELIRLAEQEAWKGDSAFGMGVLVEVPEIFAGRLDAVQPEMVRVMKSLSESNRLTVAWPAKEMLRQWRPGRIEEPTHGE